MQLSSKSHHKTNLKDTVFCDVVIKDAYKCALTEKQEEKDKGINVLLLLHAMPWALSVGPNLNTYLVWSG